MGIDWGGLKILGFFGFIMALVAYDIIKTRREIEADKRKAATPMTEATPQPSPEMRPET